MKAKSLALSLGCEEHTVVARTSSEGLRVEVLVVPDQAHPARRWPVRVEVGHLFTPTASLEGDVDVAPALDRGDWLFEAGTQLGALAAQASEIIVQIAPPAFPLQQVFTHATCWEAAAPPAVGWGSAEPFALRANGGVVRHVEGVPGTRAPRKRKARLRVALVVVGDGPEVRYVAEAHHTTLKARSAVFRLRTFGLDTPITTVGALEEALVGLQGSDIVHIVAHGTETAAGREAALRLNATEVAPAGFVTARLAGLSAQAALFDTCFASRTDALVDFGRTTILERAAEFVVAPAQPMHCVYAAAFGRGFYESLSQGSSVVEAVTRGRIAIHAEGSPEAATRRYLAWCGRPAPDQPASSGGEAEWHVPRLFSRFGLDDPGLRHRPLLPMRPLVRRGLPIAVLAVLAVVSGVALARHNEALTQALVPHHRDGDRIIYHLSATQAFGLDVTEVSVGKFSKCVEAGACVPPLDGISTKVAWNLAANYGVKGREGHPVVFVNVEQAESYCTFVGGRLPTVAEMRHASGGEGGLGWPLLPARRTYCWGETEPSCTGPHPVNMLSSDQGGGCAGDGTVAVDDPAYRGGATPEGAMHLCGNAWEWAIDTEAEQESDRYVTVGGGFWRDSPKHFRTDTLEVTPDWKQDPEIGFRCAYDDTPPADERPAGKLPPGR